MNTEPEPVADDDDEDGNWAGRGFDKKYEGDD